MSNLVSLRKQQERQGVQAFYNGWNFMQNNEYLTAKSVDMHPVYIYNNDIINIQKQN